MDSVIEPFPYGLRNPYRNVKSENSQEYAQKPERNCMFMKLVSVQFNSSLQRELTAAGYRFQVSPLASAETCCCKDDPEEQTGDSRNSYVLKVNCETF